MNDYYVARDDARYDLLAKSLAQQGKRVFRHLEKLHSPAVFVFSLREGRDRLSTLLSRLPRGSVAVVGRADGEQKRLCEENGILLIPLLEREDYLRQNGLETAQGVLAELIARTDTVLECLSVLVMGYGNCGKAIASLLWLCGCEVTVHARQRGLAAAERDGFNLFFPSNSPAPFDVIVNTVPDKVFSDEFLDLVTPDTLILQVASGLSGRETGDFLRRGLLFHPLPGLPGRYSPQREADLIGGIISQELQRRRDS